MILNIYAGNKKIIGLVQHYKLDRSRILTRNHGFVAVPGGKAVDEDKVRKWASAYGYKVSKTVEVDDGEDIPIIV